MFDKKETLVLSVEGMHCNHCKAKVENGLKSLKGVKSASAELASGEATVVYTPAKISESAIADAVNALGFSAKLK